MKDKILEKLDAIEQEHNVKIIYAVESGSRAWGFESPNSDYDVRFIFVRQPADYLSPFPKRDVIEKSVDEDNVELVGWDIQKALQLFNKSNPPLIEWLNSSIIYREKGTTINKMRKLMEASINETALMHHYYNMAKGNSKDELYFDKENNLVKYKKYFYVLRSLFACQWILNNHTVPPIKFDILMADITMPPEVCEEISSLLEKKKLNSELKTGLAIHTLDVYIEFLLKKLNPLNYDLNKLPNNEKWLSKLNSIMMSALGDRLL